MLTIVLAFKQQSRRREIPKVLYLGHDRAEAKKVTVPEGYRYVETQHVAPGFGRKWASNLSTSTASTSDQPPLTGETGQESGEGSNNSNPTSPLGSDISKGEEGSAKGNGSDDNVDATITPGADQPSEPGLAATGSGAGQSSVAANQPPSSNETKQDEAKGKAEETTPKKEEASDKAAEKAEEAPKASEADAKADPKPVQPDLVETPQQKGRNAAKKAAKKAAKNK